jgi:hypothetical protein
MRVDRDELLRRVDLPALADELLGGHKGHGLAARWPSPDPTHPQTDHRGTPRWHCFATGHGGTAIDLLCVARGWSPKEAIDWLAHRTDLPPSRLEPGPSRASPPPPVDNREPSAEMRTYIEVCARLLWEPIGTRIRQWLVDERGLDPDTLHRNLIGADPGPRQLHRAGGLPHRGPAAVFPALGANGTPVYLQARYLVPPAGRGKYDNPTALHGRNPRVAHLSPTTTPAIAPISGIVCVTEGIPDALVTAAAGYPSIGVLGAGLPDRRVVDHLASVEGLLVIAFDADSAGRAGTQRLAELLASRGRDHAVLVPRGGDVNQWARQTGAGFAAQLRLALRLATCGTSCGRARGRSIA